MVSNTTAPDTVQCPCDNCRALYRAADSRRAEAVALKTRARLLEESIVADEPREVVAFHALLLLKTGEARGLW